MCWAIFHHCLQESTLKFLLLFSKVRRLIFIVAAAASSCIMPITMTVETFYLVTILLLTLPFMSTMTLFALAFH